jgi:PilZ domain.
MGYYAKLKQWCRPMLGTNLTLGTKLELEILDEKGERVVPTLVSQFETLLPDGTMEILSPIFEGRIYPVKRGTRLNVIYQKDGDLFRFQSETVGRSVEGNIHFLQIKPLSEAEKIQRRYFFRFKCVRDVLYRMYPDQMAAEGERRNYKTGITKDISGGGICLLSDEKPDIGWYVEGWLHIDLNIPFRGRVVRIADIHDGGRYGYEIGIEFVDITNMNRERIISYIFEEQRKLIKKGWTK